MHYSLQFGFVLIYAHVVLGAKILGVLHIPSYSHFQLGEVILNQLAAKGHDITIVSPYEVKDLSQNMKHVNLSGFVEDIEAIKHHIMKDGNAGSLSKDYKIYMFGLYMSEYVLEHRNIKALLKSDETFDLVILLNFKNEAFAGFGSHYNAPFVFLNSMGPSKWTNSIMGNHDNPAYMTDTLLNFGATMSFWERLHNTIIYTWSESITHFYALPKQIQFIQKYFPRVPRVTDLMYNASQMLLNSNPSMSVPVPLLPNMIEIGGYHVRAPRPLPKDLKDFLDSAEHGAIFFSLGSNMKSTLMTKSVRNAIINSFAKLKQKVLWKWESDVLPGKPPNVKLAKWLPQQDILAHPNVRLFITHCGLLSTTEAVHHGVPILGIPIFADQELNMARAQEDGYGIGVPYNNFSETAFSWALREMLKNPKYSENSQHKSKILRDRKEKPLDTVIYWLEYVIRHGGTPNYLKSSALELCWYQILLLDVIGTLVLGTVIVFLMLGKILTYFAENLSLIYKNKQL